MAESTPAAPAGGTPQQRNRVRRPNYNLIHKRPLPVKIQPLPPLIPHNPLSILTVLWVWFRTSIWDKPEQVVYTGVFSPETRSVNIHDWTAVRALWEDGFFGKGTLSRSEPTWLEREKRKKGLIAAETSEEVRSKRRQERKKFKEDRALKEREEIAATLKRERGEVGQSEVGTEVKTEDADAQNGSIAHDEVDAIEKGLKQLDIAAETDVQEPLPVEEIDIENIEHLQLTLEEAFFLAYGLGVLKIVVASETDPSGFETIPTSALLSLFREFSVFPPTPPLPNVVSPTDSFVANYAVYHHFRSLGWVVRPGPKFAVDWMLYNRGPAFSHAEFAVMTVPSYSHAFWKTDEGVTMLKKAGVKDTGKSWHWLHMVNRVQSQVKKTLVLAYVEMPPPRALTGVAGMVTEAEAEPATSLFRRMQVREVLIRRWIPNRQRD